MDRLTRRGAIGMGVVSGAALFEAPGRAAADDKAVIVAGEKAVLFKVKGVAIERVDRGGRAIAGSLADAARPVSLATLPLEDGIRIRVSFIFPGGANNVPFDWDRLEGLVGKRVSMMLRAESGRLTVDSIATAND